MSDIVYKLVEYLYDNNGCTTSSTEDICKNLHQLEYTIDSSSNVLDRYNHYGVNYIEETFEDEIDEGKPAYNV